jgi:hypothetical protein
VRTYMVISSDDEPVASDMTNAVVYMYQVGEEVGNTVERGGRRQCVNDQWQSIRHGYQLALALVVY